LSDPDADRMIAPSQGIHLVFDKSFLRADSALMVPRTSDGRVLFAIPWHNHTVVGTTDTPIPEPVYEPRPLEEEIDFILETAAKYLIRPPQRSDVLSVYVGIRPLVKSDASGSKTSSLSRDHVIHIDNYGLLTITGGKWTTYRRMAQDAVDRAAMVGGLLPHPCTTEALRIHGWLEDPVAENPLRLYGADASRVRDLMDRDSSLGKRLHDRLPLTGAQVVWAVRQEMARTVEDVLARRCRALLLDAAAAIEAAPAVAALMARELRRGRRWQRDQVAAFTALAEGYRV